MAKSFFAALMLALLLSGCGGSTSQPVTLVSITVTPQTASIAPGTTIPFRALENFSDGNAVDVTSSATWSSTTPAVATVSNLGVATAVGAGTSTISAAFGGLGGSATLTVAALQSITISPANPGVTLVGGTRQFGATGTLSNGATQNLTGQVIWNSSSPATATINPATGLATGVASGTTQITATITTTSGTVVSAPVTLTAATVVSLALSPVNPTLDAGATQQFTATGTLSDANSTTLNLNSQVTWSSNTTSVVTVNSSGVASALSPGTAIITATFQGVAPATSTVTVLGPTSITVTPTSPNAVAGSTQQFTATGTFADGSTHDLTNQVTWSSLTPAIATISNAVGSQGLATVSNTANGTTIIQATLGAVSGSSALAAKTLSSIAVTPLNPSLSRGASLQFTATGTFVDNSTQDLTNAVTWSSSLTGVASVSNIPGTKGLVTGLAIGSSTIRATIGNQPPGTNVVTVTTSVVTTPANLAFVTNFGSNNVSVIDLVGNSVVATIPVGSGPQGVAVNPAANRAYVANIDGTLSVIDITSNHVVTTFNLQGGGGSWGVAVLPALNRVYIANSSGRTLSVVNTVTNTLVSNVTVGAVPRGVVANPATNQVYVANSGDGTVSVVNGNTLATSTIAGVGLGPQEIALHTGTGRAYVANSLSNILEVINTATNALATTFAAGTGVHLGVAVNPTTNRVYVANNNGTVSAINSATNAELSPQFSPILVGTGPQGVTVRASTNQLFVVNNGNNTVSVINTAGDTNTVSATIQVGAGPREIAVLP